MRNPIAALPVAGLIFAVVPAAPVWGDPGATRVIHVSPAGSDLTAVQAQVRSLIAHGQHQNIVVELAGGTYRLSAPLVFDSADSGRDGHTITWTAAPGAKPVLSGATRVSGWRLADPARDLWQAPLPAGVDTRQLYVNGVEAPIAQTTPAEQGIMFAAAPGGYTVSPASWASTLRPGTEFVYTGGNGAWTQSRCQVASVAGAAITMQQPCWNNVTNRAVFQDASGHLPSMAAGTAPSLIENSAAFLHPGQWYLDKQAGFIDYVPTPGQRVSGLDVEAPRLQTLISGAGTLDRPVHDLTFSGLTFAHATWTGPSAPAGFADVQDNLTLTGADPNQPQGTCTFSTPVGTCPFGALTREPGNVSWRAAHDVAFVGNTFTDLGAAGLVFDYGSRNDLIEGNTFADIAGNGVILGDTTDPHPSDVGADSREINSGTTIADNVIHDIGTDYPSAAAITLFFTQHTTVSHNDLYDLPYTGISAGVVEGHVDNADHPDESTNVNSDNTVSDNLIHRYMQVLKDGGAVYVEGHQGQTITAPDGSVDRAASIAHGLTVSGNVAFDQGNVNFTWYDDAGSQWIGWHANVEWGGSGRGQGGCQPTGHLDFTGDYSSEQIGQWHCAPPLPVDTNVSADTAIPAAPTTADLPLSILANAGPRGAYRHLVETTAPGVEYVSAAAADGTVADGTVADGTAADGTVADGTVADGTVADGTVLIAGHGFGPGTRVSFGAAPARSVRVLATGLITAVVPVGSDPCQVTVTTPGGSATGACAIATLT